MAEGYSLGSEEVYELFCDPCKHDGHTIEAEGFCVNCNDFLCGTCNSYHTKPMPSRNHKVLGRDEMPKRKPDMKNIHAKTEYDECSKHIGKSLKYFCGLHKDFGCSVCMTIGHRGCEDVQYIPEVAANITASEEFVTIERKLRKVAEAAIKNEKKVQKNIDDIDKCHLEINKDISQFRDEINSYLDELEKRIRQQADDQIKQIKQELDMRLPNYNQISLDVRHLETEIENLVETGQNNRLFMKLKTTTKEINTLEERSLTLERENIIKYVVFKQNPKLAQIKESMSTFGTLLRGKPCTATHLKDVSVKSSSDSKRPTIIGIVVMSEGRCVLADSTNQKIKLLDMNNDKVISELRIEDTPRGICKINNSEVAITYACTVQYISVIDRLCDGRKIKINGAFSITFNINQENLLISKDREIKNICVNGTVTKSIGSNFGDISSISLSPDDSTVYVSDGIKHTISSFTMNGDKVADYIMKETAKPKGITVDQEGFVYVCDYGSNTIHFITPGDENTILLLDKNNISDRPLSVAVSVKERHLFVGSENCDIIKVFQLL